MDIIGFRESNCKNCYKCLRNCHVKAISFENEQAKIIEEDCILCGECLQECSQGLRYSKSDLSKIKSMIKNGDRIFVSLAPNYIGVFKDVTLQKMAGVFQQLGFAGVAETAIGAEAVAHQCYEFSQSGKMNNIITTGCPSIVMLVEKYYPNLVSCLTPVVSPMVAHGRMIKDAHETPCKVVYIGSCIAQNYEATADHAIDGVIRFSELKTWMLQENIVLEEVKEGEAKEVADTNFRLYPVSGGMVKAVKSYGDIPYKMSAVDGVDRCMDVLNALDSGEITNCFIEMSSCGGSCAGNIATKRGKNTFLAVRDRIIENVGRQGKALENMPPKTVYIGRTFAPRIKKKIMPSKGELEEILEAMGKTNKELHINCGSCGYKTCVEKAIAVYEGRAEISMCVPYMRERAESMANVIIENTPNGLLLLNREQYIVQGNGAAVKILSKTSQELVGRQITEVLPNDAFADVRRTRINRLDEKVVYEGLGIVVMQSIVRVRKDHMYVVLLKDVTIEEQQLRKINRAKEDTVLIAQKVIDKQMRVAQEIASLLGETTAETKVALTKLKKSILEDK